MIRKLVNHPVSILLMLTLVSKGIGFLREMVLAYYFGTGKEYDVFLIAYTFPIIIISVTSYAFPNFIIPRIGKNKSNEYKYLTFYFLLSLSFSVILFLFARQIVLIIDPTLEVKYINVAVKILHYLAFYTLFFNLFNIYKSFFQSRKRFVLPAASQLLVHLMLIFIVVMFQGQLGVLAIGIGLITGTFFQLVIPFAIYHFQNKFKLDFNVKGISAGITISVFIIFLVEVVGQINSFVDRYFAAKLDTGVISALNYGNVLYILPTSLFILSIGTIIFPFFRDYFSENNYEKLRKTLSNSYKIILLFGLPIFILFHFFSEIIVQVIFERGKFDTAATDITSGIISIYSFGIPFVMLHFVFSRLLLVMKKENILFIGNLIGFTAKIIFLVLMGSSLNYKHIPFSTIISVMISCFWIGIWSYYYFIKLRKGLV